MSNIPNIGTLMREMGMVGQRMVEIDAAEGAAGNLSIYMRELRSDKTEGFREQAVIELPVATPALADGWMLITGAGRRLRDIADSPETTLCLLHIDDRGKQAVLLGGSSVRPTSELNSHLGIHNDQVGRRNLSYHGVVHAQPPHLTYLSHITPPGDTVGFNRRLLRWQPETIMQFPTGIALLPFEVPGTLEQAEVTTTALRSYRAAVWQRHGMVARADKGVRAAGDLIDYAETAARYVYMNLLTGEPGSGLSDEEMRLMCERMGIEQRFF
ncbi:MAG: class II aldolase/adducin family protein [Herpetosiphonaceae bacterium]|nr:class II aldolase/adducin family protein [Herpetosiphonaceae bacterium]